VSRRYRCGPDGATWRPTDRPIRRDRLRPSLRGRSRKRIVRLQRETLLGFAGWPDEGWHLRTIVEAFEVLEQIRQAVGAVAWMAARQARDHCSVLYESDVRRLFEAAREFTGWVEQVASTPEPDWWDE
jgi:hypothetical protein